MEGIEGYGGDASATIDALAANKTDTKETIVDELEDAKAMDDTVAAVSSQQIEAELEARLKKLES